MSVLTFFVVMYGIIIGHSIQLLNIDSTCLKKKQTKNQKLSNHAKSHSLIIYNELECLCSPLASKSKSTYN